jgi:glycosyl hydrolase family 26
MLDPIGRSSKAVSALARRRAVAVAIVLVIVVAVVVLIGHRRPATIALGVNLAGVPGAAGVLDRYTASVRRPPAILMWFQSFSEPLYYGTQLKAIERSGATPLITWLPLDHGKPIPMRAIANGAWDDTIRRAAGLAKATGRPLYLRFAHEMNLPHSQWGAGEGNRPADYVAAWRRVVDVFRTEDARNVRFVWSPDVDDGSAPFAAWYPGDDYVDWVGLDGYNWGTARPGSRWQSLLDVFGPSYARLTRLSDRPVMIAETASAEAGGDKAAWIRQGLSRDVPERMPRVRAVVWFSRDKETDWRVDSSPSSLAAFRQVAGSPRYSGALG